MIRRGWGWGGGDGAPAHGKSRPPDRRRRGGAFVPKKVGQGLERKTDRGGGPEGTVTGWTKRTRNSAPDQDHWIPEGGNQ